MKNIGMVLSVICFFAASAGAQSPGADPNRYHWKGQAQFFEGWYFKVSDPDTQKSYLFIYAVLNPDGLSPHSQAFIMVGHNAPGVSVGVVQQYDVTDFTSSYERFDTRIADANHIYGDFESEHLEGSVTDGVNTFIWQVDLSIQERWARTMGWMAALPDLQTYWHVGAMQARASGWVEWNGETFTFEDILGYQEKNWGREFPESWYWLQANNFDDPKACCISVGGGSMPIGSAVLDAGGIGFRYDDRLYSFSFPVQPVRIQTDISPGDWQIEARRGLYKIELSGSSDPDELINLMNPTETGLFPYTWETITGDLTVRLYKKAGAEWNLVVDTVSDLAGLEFGGEEWVGWDQ